MSTAKRIIEVDEATARTLEARASKRGVSVSELIAEMATLQGEVTTTATDEIAELDRRWAAIEAGEATVPHDAVARWLETWGTPSFRPWKNQ
jgi:predicted transcriptional regulator